MGALEHWPMVLGGRLVVSVGGEREGRGWGLRRVTEVKCSSGEAQTRPLSGSVLEGHEERKVVFSEFARFGTS